MDDNLIKPVNGQSIFSIKSAKDKNLNDKKKQQNSRQHKQSSEDEIISEVEKPDIDKNNNGIDFCA